MRRQVKKVRRQIKINKIIKNWKQGLGTCCSSGWDLRVRPKSKCCETASKRSGVIGGSNPRVQTLRAIVGGFLTHRKLANFRENLPKHPCSIYVITLSSKFGGERERMAFSAGCCLNLSPPPSGSSPRSSRSSTKTDQVSWWVNPLSAHLSMFTSYCCAS